jgi:Kef-type K+ transport system membrane component KefB
MNFSGFLSQLPLLGLELSTILVVTSICGAVAASVRQPRVVGEIAGGLVLGPMVFGHLFPTASTFLFASSRQYLLEAVSNTGLVLFLFLIGAELDLSAVRRNRGASFKITVASIVLPFALGVALSPFLLARFGVGEISHVGFILFTGIAMSITALPVLARIIEERKRAGRPIDNVTATTALVCAAANDLVAWSLLAVTLALISNGRGGNHGVQTTTVRLFVLAAYVGGMLLLVRPGAARLLSSRYCPPRWAWFSFVVVFAFLSAHITESLGVHAFVGAFLAGVCIPRPERRDQSLEGIFQQTLQPIVRLCLPVFFVITGLRMQREMFSIRGLSWFAIILLAAVVGKIGGGMLAARGSGISWRAAAQIGILLNTRGLVELIALNVGYKAGILDPMLFTLFVLMAITTTAMTVPLFEMSSLIPETEFSEHA